ncbi:MAG: hypothetical protein ABSA91_02645 [Acidimicrobiales bacterium]
MTTSTSPPRSTVPLRILEGLSVKLHPASLSNCYSHPHAGNGPIYVVLALGPPRFVGVERHGYADPVPGQCFERRGE